jgi:hypothetical protein
MRAKPYATTADDNTVPIVAGSAYLNTVLSVNWLKSCKFHALTKFSGNAGLGIHTGGTVNT